MADRTQWKSSSSIRSDNTDGLVHRMLDGLGSNKYKAVDYHRLRATISAKRFGSIKTSMKVSKIEQKSQQHKENSTLKQHQLLWHKEFLKLQHLRKKFEVDVEIHMRSNRNSESCGHIYKDFDYCDAALSSDFDGFKKNTVDPVWCMRDDLRYWLSENREELQYGSPNVIEKYTDIQKTVTHVKEQQEEIINKLDNEQKRLEAELCSGLLLEMCPPQLKKHTVVHPGIPQEAIDLSCPDLQLKSDVLQEFLIIDGKYESMIDQLGQRHALALSQENLWGDEEHFKFVAIHDQYPRELANRRALLFDRLKRHLPEKSRSDMSDHEDWWMDFKYYHERLKGIYADWARDRRELLHKAQMTFAEAAVAHELEEVRGEYCNRQKQLCQVLYEKVREWRERKMEVMQLEAQMNEERQKQAEEIEAREREAEKCRRKKEKEILGQYHQVKEKKQQELEEERQRRLDELKSLMEKQSIYDRERIRYREEQINKKLEERKKKEEEKEIENEEMEARLEALRAQVRIVAESDPFRAIQGTKAWEARLKPEEDKNISLLEPLFKVNSYTSKQITSDHRVRLEQKLREAGLHNSDYARQLIRKATPPMKPRRDQLHTFKFEDASV
ncbi:unnamed protein product [Lymnaea stagnalis]|uniref:Coiled-coil domain-containing protein 148 n=1 Tax=Lymnaea stagnalis TaxID=6523 RepID=A0AAV2H3W4_LYMST